MIELKPRKAFEQFPEHKGKKVYFRGARIWKDYCDCGVLFRVQIGKKIIYISARFFRDFKF